ncbi:type II secretion system F family protein [Oceanibacterium hippocampi]|uniref:Bacterial type II secretion system protein F domain protein n=1 Tax=Oceanibacterium hippocampi TaxID=745714 RepID=A0A1Y5SC91_9PROT|nr:type II secretion system F family protein [Oceanibacterium hippocampi]SLN36683.1 Bacterial type II secretion system protein F domain protein [Oceanibacterium hippocampi]
MDLAAMLPDGMTGEQGIFLFGLLALIGVVTMVWIGLTERDPLPARIKALEQRRDVLRDGLKKPATRRRARDEQIGMMRKVVTQLRLMRGKQAEAMSRKLARAGYRSKDALVVFLFAKLAMPFIAGVAGLLCFYYLNPFDLKAPLPLLCAIVSVVVGAYVPEVFVKNATQKRHDNIRKALPDALDLLVICAEAGLNLDTALDRVCREMARSAPELSDEFGLAGVELTFLPERRKALDNLVARCDLPGIKGLVGTLVQTEKYGTPLARSLRVLSSELRDERLMRAEEKAARLPAVLTVPMIVFIMPALFVVLIGPATLRAIDALSKGF